jgi:hypothetical protein
VCSSCRRTTWQSATIKYMKKNYLQLSNVFANGV